MTTKAEFMKQVLDEGVPVAYAALLEIAQNPKSPAQARVAASRTIVEMGGVATPSDASAEKEPHEMTADELQAKIKALRDETIVRSQPVIDVKPRRIPPVKGVFG